MLLKLSSVAVWRIDNWRGESGRGRTKGRGYLRGAGEQ